MKEVLQITIDYFLTLCLGFGATFVMIGFLFLLQQGITYLQNKPTKPKPQRRRISLRIAGVAGTVTALIDADGELSSVQHNGKKLSYDTFALRKNLLYYNGTCVGRCEIINE